MSLRKKISAEVASQEQEQAARSETEAAEAKEAEMRERFAEISSYDQKLQKIDELRSKLEENLVARESGRQHLKDARGDIREAWQDSQQLEDESAHLPKPAEILKSEEFAAEEEVTAYEDVRTGIQELLAEKDRIHAEILSEFGGGREELSTEDSRELMQFLEVAKEETVESIRNFIEANPNLFEEQLAAFDAYEEDVSSAKAAIESDIANTGSPREKWREQFHPESIERLDSMSLSIEELRPEFTKLERLILSGRIREYADISKHTLVDRSPSESLLQEQRRIQDERKALEGALGEKQRETFKFDPLGTKESKRSDEEESLREEIAQKKEEEDAKYQEYIEIFKREVDRIKKLDELFYDRDMQSAVEEVLGTPGRYEMGAIEKKLLEKKQTLGQELEETRGNAVRKKALETGLEEHEVALKGSAEMKQKLVAMHQRVSSV